MRQSAASGCRSSTACVPANLRAVTQTHLVPPCLVQGRTDGHHLADVSDLPRAAGSSTAQLGWLVVAAAWEVSRCMLLPPLQINNL